MSEESLLEKPASHDPDRLCFRSSRAVNATNIQDYLIFFLPGNPGLISFYEPFLYELHKLLESKSAAHERGARFHICGHSYHGFEVSPYSEPASQMYGLDEQIEFQEKVLMQHVRKHQKETNRNPKVILMGHSVGSYILLELIQRHWDAVNDTDVEDFDLIGGILLFPTIADIAKSPLGRTARIVLRLPNFARIMGAVARALAHTLPLGLLKWLAKLVTKFPEYAADTVVSFLRSPTGVRQALHLARDEMSMINEADWDNEVWGAARSQGTNKRDTINWNLVMFWGRSDRWVADHTRDKLIEARGGQHGRRLSGQRLPEGKAEMVIDDRGIPHDFCTTLHNSEYVAGLSADWIDGIIEKHGTVL